MTPLKIGILADLQYCDSEPDTVLNRYFRNSLPKIDEILRCFNTEDLDFIVNLGDTIDHDFDSFDAITKKLSLFRAPLFNLPGNHDYDVAPEKKKLVVEQLGLKKNYFFFDKGDIRFCFLDGNEISTFATEEGSVPYQEAVRKLEKMRLENKTNANEWNGGIGKEQLRWFVRQLDEAAASGMKVVAFCHFPIFPDSKHSLLNYEEILDVINKYPNIIAWLCGHNHDGNYGKLNNCHILNFRGIVDTADENAFCILEISDDSLNLKSYGREIERGPFSI